jgi:hypothetical protein
MKSFIKTLPRIIPKEDEEGPNFLALSCNGNELCPSSIISSEIFQFDYPTKNSTSGLAVDKWFLGLWKGISLKLAAGVKDINH